MLLQGTPCCSRVLHCSIGCYSTAGNTTSTAGDAISTAGMQSTAGDAIYCRRCKQYPSGYHTNTGYMAFELSHISYHMAPEHAMLLQGTPCCSRVLHCSIGCYSTAGNTTSTAGDAIASPDLLQSDTRRSLCPDCRSGYMAFELSYGLQIYCRGCNIYCRDAIYCRGCKQLPQRIPH